MAINLDGMQRPKLETVVTVSSNTIEMGTPIETDGVEESIFIPIERPTDPPSFTADGNTTNGDATVTGATGAFANVRVGDVVTGTGIPADTTVAAVTNAQSIELSANATATGTGVTLTFDPPSVDATIFAVKITFTKTGNPISTLGMTVQPFAYNGSLGGTAGTASNATQNGSQSSVSVNIDTFLTNQRVPKTNS